MGIKSVLSNLVSTEHAKKERARQRYADLLHDRASDNPASETELAEIIHLIGKSPKDVQDDRAVVERARRLAGHAAKIPQHLQASLAAKNKFEDFVRALAEQEKLDRAEKDLLRREAECAQQNHQAASQLYGQLKSLWLKHADVLGPMPELDTNEYGKIIDAVLKHLGKENVDAAYGVWKG